MQNEVRDEVGPNFPSEPEFCTGVLASAAREIPQAPSTDTSLPSLGNGPASGAILNSFSLDLSSSNVDLHKLAWLPPIEQYRWHRDHNPVFREWRGWRAQPESLLPNGLMAKYRGRVEAAQKGGREPSIASDLLLVHDAFGKERWDALRTVEKVEELRLKEKPDPRTLKDMEEVILFRQRQRHRYKDIMWLDELWSRCIAFEAEHGIFDEERVRERFKRFPFGVFPTLAERNEAERRAEEGEK